MSQIIGKLLYIIVAAVDFPTLKFVAIVPIESPVETNLKPNVAH